MFFFVSKFSNLRLDFRDEIEISPCPVKIQNNFCDLTFPAGKNQSEKRKKTRKNKQARSNHARRAFGEFFELVSESNRRYYEVAAIL